MVEVLPSVELEAFEQIEAVPGQALLRVAAQAPPSLVGNGPLALMIGSGSSSERLEQLPGPPDDSGMLRAAFSVPMAVLQQGVTFVLEFANGNTIELPAPTPGTRRIARPQDRRQAIAELEQQLASERERRLQVESDLEQLAGERAALQSALRDLESDLASTRGETARGGAQVRPLERRLVDTLGELTVQTAARSDAEFATGTLARELEETREQARLAAEQAHADLERANADALEVARNFELEAAAREVAERRAERLHADATELEQLRAELEQVRSKLATAQTEASEASTLAVQWQAEAERAKETAGRALAEAQALRESVMQARSATEAAPAAEEPADEPEPPSEEPDEDAAPDDSAPETDRRVAAERELAERQAINREVLRRAARQREQRARRHARRKLERHSPRPPDSGAAVDARALPEVPAFPPASSRGAEPPARLVEARPARATATPATIRAFDEQLSLSTRVARLPREVLLGTGLLVLGLMLALLIAGGAVRLGQ